MARASIPRRADQYPRPFPATVNIFPPLPPSTGLIVAGLGRCLSADGGLLMLTPMPSQLTGDTDHGRTAADCGRADAALGVPNNRFVSTKKAAASC